MLKAWQPSNGYWTEFHLSPPPQCHLQACSRVSISSTAPHPKTPKPSENGEFSFSLVKIAVLLGFLGNRRNKSFHRIVESFWGKNVILRGKSSIWGRKCYILGRKCQILGRKMVFWGRKHHILGGQWGALRGTRAYWGTRGEPGDSEGHWGEPGVLGGTGEHWETLMGTGGLWEHWGL